MDLSIIIPTYNEKENIQNLLERIYNEFKKNNIHGEVIVVDDGSPDGTGEIVENLKKNYKTLQCIHRQNKLGLSSAVLKGFSVSKSEILGVMDSDLSHPPEKINLMYQTIKKDNFDLVIGSRYIKEGKIVGWNLYRKGLSKGVTLLARIFTNVKDPMAGYFFIKKKCLEGVDLNSKGFKILLEILIKAKYNRVKEIPIIFINRTKGKSKAGMIEIIYYFGNLIRYLKYKKRVLK
jgi:dolichol-phosphate mannosyltransferase